MKHLIRYGFAAAVASLLLISLPGRGTVAQRAELPGLASLYETAAGAVRDTNGDGLADSVAARVILPAEPSVEEVQGATNIAARLGFETTALTLPIVLKATDVSQPPSIAVPILIGRSNALLKPLIDRGAIDISSLKPGQGLVAVVSSPLGGSDGLVVVGADDEGTLNAANELAAYLPRLWGSSGARLVQVETQAVRYLKSNGITGAVRGVSSVVVDSDRRGVAKTVLRVNVPAGEATRAVRAIEQLDTLHRRGLEPETLNYASVASTEVEIWSDGKKTGSASVRRTGLNARTLTPPIEGEGRGGRGGRGAAAPGPAAGRGAGGGRGGAPAAGAAEATEPPSTGTAQTPPPAGATGEGPGAAPAAEGGGFGVVAAPIPAKTFNLANAYSIDGWLGDSYVDLIPDRLETTVVVGDGKESIGAAHIATRLGLESTGVTLPLARDARKVTNAAAEPNPIVVGRTNELTRQLVKLGKVRLDDLRPGEGAIQIVPKAFGPPTATVVAGADAAGTDAAATYLARRLPYLWDVTRGSFRLEDLTAEATDFLAAKTGGAQASLAVGEVDNVLRSLEGKSIESFDATVYLEDANPAFDTFLTGRVKNALKGAGAVTIKSQGITDPVTVFEDKIDIPWEVDDFWATFKSDVLPKVKAGSSVEIETRLSESPQVRKGIADEIRSQLTKAGATAPRVRVLSAYKQGFLWLTEVVIPEMKGKGAKSVVIKVAASNPDLTKKYRFNEVPSRWLHELYPADEFFEKQLGIPKSSFGLELVDEAKEIYSLEAMNAGGQVVYKTTFSPKFVEREYLDKFPGWARVKVTTGWISATVDGQRAIDTRIVTDPERFWDIWQSQELSKIYDHVMRITSNRPTPDKQPFHRDLDIEVWMSEPDFRIGIDEELVSSLEALHEELYFGTLAFFNALGRTTVNAGLGAPGKIFPIVHPNRPGKAGQARILYAGNAAAGARIDISYKEKGVERPTRVTRDLTRMETSAPIVTRAVVAPDRVTEIEVQAEPRDDIQGLRTVDAVENFVRLHEAGLYKTEMSYDHVGRITMAFALGNARSRYPIPNTGAARPSNVRMASAKPKLPVVTWDHVISPEESEEIVEKLSAYPEVKAYKVGRSYRRRDISLMEITLPTASELISVAKYTAYKPTIIISSRQHANEVSSTSHTLKLAELLLTDPGYKPILKKVNVIIHPVTNPDGAAMAFELQKLTPNHMLHAGRYSALGTDVGGGETALLPESRVRPKIWREWLPDIFLNPHGYPSHEWVMPFSGYVPPGFRTYWSSRGWYTSVGGTRDPRYPELSAATEAMRESIVREMNANLDVHNMNVTHQARYRRWGYGFGPFTYGQEIYKDTAIYYTDLETTEPRGNRRVPAPQPGASITRATMNQWPQVTFFTGGTEAPDETAQGEWLNLVVKAGFSYLMANVKYLRDGEYELHRIEEGAAQDGVSTTMLRVRPVRPPKSITNTRITATGGK